MADYRKMYAILCGAVDDVIEPLEKIPLAHDAVQTLRRAMLEAEEVYVSRPDAVQLVFPKQRREMP